MLYDTKREMDFDKALEEMERNAKTMTITKTVQISIDIQEIIDEYKLTKQSTDERIRKAVHEYVLAMDDQDFFLVSDKDEEEIRKTLKSILHG